jgi:hypothetical protein
MSFPTFFTAKAPAPGQEPRFSGVLIFDAAAQATEEFKRIKAAIVECAKEEWGQNVNLSALRLPIRKNEEKSHLAGYSAGGVFITAWTKARPGIIDTEGNEIIDPSLVWAGQKAQFSISPFAYTNSGNKGVSFGLRNVLIVDGSGPRLDGRAPAKSDFAGVAGFSSGGSTAADELPF